MASSLSSNIIFIIEWYLDNKASRHMTFERSLFNIFQEQEGGMSVELGDNATYPMKGVGLIPYAFR
jgi:hypothetical protein